MKLSGSVAALCGILQTLAVGVLAANGSQCHCLPSDSCWPSTAAWASLNTTVGGRLIATVPIGSPCHDPTYDAAACAALQDNWTIPEIHLETSSSVMQAYFANQSCDPFTAESRPCLLGNYVSYAVNVSSASDVSAALKFAQANNVRTVIRNTGHDFFGRSTGAGALAIWTHHLQDIDFLDWSDSYYQGRAIKVGAGVLGAAAVEAADAEGLVVVTGECPTVGLAGGYTQGGGHSALSTSFGLAADQTLEFEVVTASGAVINASRTENADLFWALSGGGGGTYGVVLSLTARAHPAATIGGAVLQMAAAYTTTANFNAAVAALHAMLPNMTDLGASVVYYVSNEILVIKPVTVYNSTAAYVRDVVLAPFTAVLAELGIPAAVEYTELSYLDHYAAYMGPLPGGSIAVEAYQFGGRLIPRAVLEESNEAFQVVLQNLTANGVLAVGTAASYAAPAGADGAVLPAWRGATIQMQLTTPWNSTAPWADMVAAQLLMTDDFMPQIEAVTPGSGSYMNEADFRQPNWQEVFFGANYLPLLAIKEKWDPEGQFYILKGVGSEAWTVDGDGRMCRA